MGDGEGESRGRRKNSRIRRKTRINEVKEGKRKKDEAFGGGERC